MIVDTNEWVVIESPGYAGKNKKERDDARNKLYGQGNWKIACGE